METATPDQVLEKEEIEATPGSGAKLIREIKHKTRKRFSTEEKIRIVLDGFRKEIPVSELCRRENVASCLYYSWLKDFMEAGKAKLKGDSGLTLVRESKSGYNLFQSLLNVNPGTLFKSNKSAILVSLAEYFATLMNQI